MTDATRTSTPTPHRRRGAALIVGLEAAYLVAMGILFTMIRRSFDDFDDHQSDVVGSAVQVLGTVCLPIWLLTVAGILWKGTAVRSGIIRIGLRVTSALHGMAAGFTVAAMLWIPFADHSLAQDLLDVVWWSLVVVAGGAVSLATYGATEAPRPRSGAP